MHPQLVLWIQFCIFPGCLKDAVPPTPDTICFLSPADFDVACNLVQSLIQLIFFFLENILLLLIGRMDLLCF